MLKSVDILIGLSVVMLIVSMAVTLVNQGILAMLAKRGRCLQAGIADLLKLVDASFTKAQAEDLAARLLTQPTIRRMTLWSWLPDWFPACYEFGDVIHREDLTKILLSMGAPQDETKKRLDELKIAIGENSGGAARAKVDAALTALEDAIKRNPAVKYDKIENMLKEINGNQNPTDQLKSFNELNAQVNTFLDPLLEKLNSALKANGIEEPGKTMENVRMMALQLERAHPELACNERQNNALLQEASSQFLSKINLGFDQVMDRVSTRFTYNTRIVTLFSAVLVAVVLQLDTVNLLNRFAMDDKMRDAFVDLAVKAHQDEEVKKLAQPAAKPEGREAKPVEGNPQPAPTAAVGADKTAKAGQKEQAGNDNKAETAPTDTKEEKLKTQKFYLTFLAEQGVITLPASFEEWGANWTEVNIPGLLLSILLLSLGAPFWYNALGKLLQLRSILAQKDDAQKLVRQTSQTPKTPADSVSAAVSSSPVDGERGDLNAVG